MLRTNPAAAQKKFNKRFIRNRLVKIKTADLFNKSCLRATCLRGRDYSCASVPGKLFRAFPIQTLLSADRRTFAAIAVAAGMLAGTLVRRHAGVYKKGRAKTEHRNFAPPYIEPNQLHQTKLQFPIGVIQSTTS
jgi:hypothetical protein